MLLSSNNLLILKHKIMNKLIFTVLFLFAMSTTGTQAQSAFDKAMTDLHKTAINTCGMIKSKDKHDDAKVLKSLQNFKELAALDQKKFVKSPPPEYAKDPLLSSYFMELDDIINALTTRVEKGNYKAATMNCSRICMVFYKMHLFNGQLELTDMMFMWTMQITFTQNMVNAGNYKGAKANIQKVSMLYKKVLGMKEKKNSSEFNNEFKSIDKLYNSWVKAFTAGNYKEAANQFKEFNAAFAKVFKDSL